VGAQGQQYTVADRMVLQTLSFFRRLSLLSLSFSFRRFISPCKPINGTVTAGQVVGGLDIGEANHDFLRPTRTALERLDRTGFSELDRVHGRRGALSS
jgi:hypothetical protein